MRNDLTKEELWALRQEIVLGSLFYRDYKNSFGINEHACCDFFDGYLEHIEMITNKELKDIELCEFDNESNLYDYYCCIEF